MYLKWSHREVTLHLWFSILHSLRNKAYAVPPAGLACLSVSCTSALINHERQPF